jgi:hypothetical protein
MQVHSEICWEGCPTNRAKSPKSGRRFSGHLPTLIFIIYGFLKMSSGLTVPDPDPELMNAQNFNFAKPELFFKNIGRYAATSTHVKIPFNFTTVFNTKQASSEVYSKLLNQHEDPFKPITKSVTDISISIAAMAITTFNTIRITQLNDEISTLKEKADVILDVVQLHCPQRE